MEKDKILQVMEKYQDYFKEWNADVAFGDNKENIFYVLAPRNEFETFLFFQTADQLERIILGTITLTRTVTGAIMAASTAVRSLNSG